MKAALEASGIADIAQLDPEVWARNRGLLRVGEPPFQIDICLGISGVGYDAAAASAVTGNYDEVPVRFLGREVLITNKRASARPKDLADVDLLTSADVTTDGAQ